jgi:hypothetical protein
MAMSALARRDLSTLVLIDAQERLCNAMEDFDRTTGRKIEQIIRAARILGVGTVVTEQYPKGLGPTVEHIREALSPVTPVIAKTSFSCWGCDSFRNAVQTIRPRTLVLAGMETHVCVQQTAIAALDEGYGVVVLADAVCSRNDYDKAIALALLRERGVTVTTVEAVVFDWIGDSQAEKFKEVSRLFK